MTTITALLYVFSYFGVLAVPYYIGLWRGRDQVRQCEIPQRLPLMSWSERVRLMTAEDHLRYHSQWLSQFGPAGVPRHEQYILAARRGLRRWTACSYNPDAALARDLALYLMVAAGGSPEDRDVFPPQPGEYP
jgi:hypothetical protein